MPAPPPAPVSSQASSSALGPGASHSNYMPRSSSQHTLSSHQSGSAGQMLTSNADRGSGVSAAGNGSRPVYSAGAGRVAGQLQGGGGVARKGLHSAGRTRSHGSVSSSSGEFAAATDSSAVEGGPSGVWSGGLQTHAQQQKLPSSGHISAAAVISFEDHVASKMPRSDVRRVQMSGTGPLKPSGGWKGGISGPKKGGAN